MSKRGQLHGHASNTIADKWYPETGESAMTATKVGIEVYCTKCRRPKAPRGRSVSPVMWNSMCTNDQCGAYYDDPKPGSLWFGETDEDFGFPCEDSATKPIRQE